MSSENKLVQKLKEHDEEAFDEIYQKYFRLVKHVVFQILPSDMIADDIVQETFLKMYENIESYQNDISFSAWLCTIAKNLALNEKKKRNRLVALPEKEKADETMSIAEKSDNERLLKQVKEVLGEKDYNLLMLRLYHGLSYKELSDMTGETVAALTNRYHRAIKKVKREIKL